MLNALKQRRKTSKLKEIRNYILGFLGVFLTVFLGSIPIFDYDAWSFLNVVAPIAISTFIVFGLFNWLLTKIEHMFVDISLSFNKGAEKFHVSNGYLSTVVLDLSIIKFAEIQSYAAFTQLLSSAMMKTLETDFKKLAEKYRLFKEFKVIFETESQKYSQDPAYVKNCFEQFGGQIRIPPKLLEFVETTLKELKPKEN